MTTFETYGSYPRRGEETAPGEYEYEVSEDDWKSLSSTLESIEPTVDIVTTTQNVEEEPPRVRPADGHFLPGGWVGEFPGGVEVIPDKINNDAYQQLLDESRGLIESFGLRTAEAALPFSPEVLNDARALYLRYSESLIDITEELVSNRLPVGLQERTHVGHELRGRPMFNQTVAIRSQGRPETVSRSVSFTFETPANRLLVRFHRELRMRLAVLTRDLELQDDVVRRRLSYHENFIENVVPEELREMPFEELALTLDEMRALTGEATGAVADMVDLWEAYRRQLTTELNPSERYDSAIKPASKVYELWCLLQVLSVLRDELGEELQRQPSRRLPNKFIFDQGIELYYERSWTAQSKYIKPLFRPAPNLRAGAPDFMLAINGSPRWVADAKFQTIGEIGLGGAQRFVSYVVDYLDQSNLHGSALLCVSETGEIEFEDIDGYRYVTLGLGPETLDRTKAVLQDELTRLI